MFGLFILLTIAEDVILFRLLNIKGCLLSLLYGLAFLISNILRDLYLAYCLHYLIDYTEYTALGCSTWLRLSNTSPVRTMIGVFCAIFVVAVMHCCCLDLLRRCML